MFFAVGFKLDSC